MPRCYPCGVVMWCCGYYGDLVRRTVAPVGRGLVGDPMVTCERAAATTWGSQTEAFMEMGFGECME